MSEIDAQEVISLILESIETMYGNLGFLSFRLHSIKPNSQEGMYYIKYSFIPREKDSKRIFYKGKADINGRKIVEIIEIQESDLAKE